MRAATVFLQVVCWLLLADPQQQRLAHSQGGAPGGSLRDTRCGPLGLYGLLIASGYDDVEYARVLAALGTKPNSPVTLGQLLAAGRRLGFDVRLGRGRLNECLRRAPVLLCRPGDPVGHVVLLRRLSAGRVELVDPSGTVVELPAGALVQDRRTYAYLYVKQYAELEAVGVAFVGFGISWIALRVARGLRRSRASPLHNPGHRN